MRNSCLPSEASPSADRALKDESVAQLLERISELEDENASLRRLEETIRANNHFFEALLRSSHEAIVLLSPALTVVRLVHSIMGYMEKDLLGQSVLAFMHPDDAPLLEKSCVCLLSGEAKSRVLEARALTPDGNWTWMEVQLRDLLDDPNVQAIVLNLRRISKPASN